MKYIRKGILEIVFGAVLLALGVLIIILLKDFTPRYIGGAIIAAFGAVFVTSGIIGLVKK